MRNKRWILNLLAVTNLLFVAWGWFLLIEMRIVLGPAALPPGWMQAFPYTKITLNVMFATCGSLLAFLAWGSIQLLRRRKGAGVCLVVYGLELLTWFGYIFVSQIAIWTQSDWLVALATSIVGNRSIGLSAIYPQMAIFYPIFAGLALLLVVVPLRPGTIPNGA